MRRDSGVTAIILAAAGISPLPWEDTMASDQPARDTAQPLVEPAQPPDPVQAAPEAGPNAGLEEHVEEGGDPACWACLVCDECGAVISEGHRGGCSRVVQGT